MATKQLRLILTGCILTAACGKDKGGDDSQSSDPGSYSPPVSGGGGEAPGGYGQGGIVVEADLSDAFGLLTLEEGGLSLTGGGGGGGLFKLTGDGSVVDALRTAAASSTSYDGKIESQPSMDLPPVKSMARSPAGHLYLHFEHTFWYADAAGAQGYECNLFRVAGATVTDLKAAGAGSRQLECVDPGTYVQNWDLTRDSVFQFDNAGNIYFPGWNSNSQGQELIRVSADLSQQKTIINSNIWFRDYFVTPNGGVFYVGQTQDSSSGGFFRYVTPQGSLQQIADGYWDFKFEPIVGETGDRAIFFGPDPRVDSADAWSTSCLFVYDPASYDINLENPIANAISPLITCGNDLYAWLELRREEDETEFGKGPYAYSSPNSNPTQAWVNEYVNRCESDGAVFAGGGQIDRIHQNSAGEIFVIGHINRKTAGHVSCDVSVRGEYCASAGGDPVAAATAGACAAAGGTWTETSGWCSDWLHSDRAACLADGDTWNFYSSWFNSVSEDVCALASTADVLAATPAAPTVHNLQINYRQCLAADNTNNPWNLMVDYKGLARVDAENKTLVPLMNDTTEEAVKFWFVDQAAYYLSKKSGVFRLKRFHENAAADTLLSNFEVYHLAKSGRAGHLVFNGLNFGTNEYVFGELEVATKTLDENESVKGKVGTLVTFD